MRNLTRKTRNPFFDQISRNEQTICSQVSWIQISLQILSPIYGLGGEDFFVFWARKVTVTYFFKQGLRFEQTCIGPGQICFCVSFIKICPVVSEEMLFLWVDGLTHGRTHARTHAHTHGRTHAAPCHKLTWPLARWAKKCAPQSPVPFSAHVQMKIINY